MRDLAPLLVITLLALPQAGRAASDEKEAGDFAAARNDFDEAGRHYEIFARQNPSEENLFFLGSFLLNHNGFEPARKLFEFTVIRYPKSARAMVGFGVAEYSLGQYDQAVQTLCSAVDLDPSDSRAFQFLGRMYDVSPRYATEVTKRLEEFVGIYPNNAFANYYYGLCLANRSSGNGSSHDDTKSYYHLHKAVELDHSLTDAHYELGVLLQRENRTAEAISEFKVATSQRSEMLKAHYRLGQLYRKSKQNRLADEEFALVQRLERK